MECVPITEMLGKTLISAERTRDSDGDDFVDFKADSGEHWRMYYEHDCCAQCTIEDIVGDLGDLVGSPIAMAEESESSSDDPKDGDDSFTWTFYKLGTAKGYVTIRWYGSSNGYYSESVTFARVA